MAIEKCCSFLRQFIFAALDYATFKEGMAKVMEPLDPLEGALDGLTKAQQMEATMYVEWLGGELERLNTSFLEDLTGCTEIPTNPMVGLIKTNTEAGSNLLSRKFWI